MSLYHVQIDRDGRLTPDDGIEYPDLATARAEVVRTAVERLRDRLRHGTTEVTIYVTDSDGRELFTATARVDLSPVSDDESVETAGPIAR